MEAEIHSDTPQDEAKEQIRTKDSDMAAGTLLNGSRQNRRAQNRVPIPLQSYTEGKAQVWATDVLPPCKAWILAATKSIRMIVPGAYQAPLSGAVVFP